MNKNVTRIASLAAASALAGGGLLATAAPAQAAGSVWDRVAACESGGNWSIATGNGYHGGLQFSASTWRAYGGSAYASTANKASKAQQIAVAQRVLAGQGAGAWPVCSKKAGLTKSNGGSASYAAPKATSANATKKAATTKKATVKKATVKKAAAPKRATTVAASSTYQGKRFVTVKRGDTLAKIARANGTSWQKVYSLNKSIVKNPNLIPVGQRIAVA